MLAEIPSVAASCQLPCSFMKVINSAHTGAGRDSFCGSRTLNAEAPFHIPTPTHILSQPLNTHCILIASSYSRVSPHTLNAYSILSQSQPVSSHRGFLKHIMNSYSAHIFSANLTLDSHSTFFSACLQTHWILTAHTFSQLKAYFLCQPLNTGFLQRIQFLCKFPGANIGFSLHIFSTESLFSLPALKHWIFTVHSFSLSVFWCKHRILTGSSVSLPALKYTGFLQCIQFLRKFPGANIGFSLEAQFLCWPWNTLDSYSAFLSSASFLAQSDKHRILTGSSFSLPALKRWIRTACSFSLPALKHWIRTACSFSRPALKHTGF